MVPRLEQVAAGSCNTWGCEIAPDGEVFFTTATCGEPILHVVLPEKVISRAGVPGVRAAKSIMEENKVFPPGAKPASPTCKSTGSGAWTAASGDHLRRRRLARQMAGPVLVVLPDEPTVWLTHHEFLDPSGVTYQGRREEAARTPTSSPAPITGSSRSTAASAPMAPCTWSTSTTRSPCTTTRAVPPTAPATPPPVPTAITSSRASGASSTSRPPPCPPSNSTRRSPPAWSTCWIIRTAGCA
jgi:hypothetical protein